MAEYTTNEDFARIAEAIGHPEMATRLRESVHVTEVPGPTVPNLRRRISVIGGLEVGQETFFAHHSPKSARVQVCREGRRLGRRFATHAERDGLRIRRVE